MKDVGFIRVVLWKIYVPMGNKLQYILLPFLRFGGQKRVRVLVLSEDGYILLVRNWFGHQNWSFPGGGIKKNEDIKDTAARELREETGISIAPAHMNYVCSSVCRESWRSFEVVIYYAAISKRQRLSQSRNIEIIDKKWYNLKTLPLNSAIPIHEIIKKTGYEQRKKYISAPSGEKSTREAR